MARKKKTDDGGADVLPSDLTWLSVRGPEQGFWRCGMKFGREEQIVGVSADEAETLRTCPELTVADATPVPESVQETKV